MTVICRLNRVSRRYGRVDALDSVTLDIAAGCIAGLVGPNGAGKTTLLRIVVGLLQPTSGSVDRPAGRERAIRYFGGERTLPPRVSARRWLALWSAAPAHAAARQRLGILSRGTRQRVGLEAVLAGPDPDLLVLDEPWEGLDPDASRWLSQQLLAKRAAGSAVLVSSHRIHELADVCDRCDFLVGGRLAPAGVICSEAASVEGRAARLFAAFDRARTAAQAERR